MFERELASLEQKGLLRRTIGLSSAPGPSVEVEGRSVLLLCANDYLGLAGHPALCAAADDAMRRYGFGTGASRLVSGTTWLHEELEKAVAAFKGTETAIVFNSGYAANTGVIPAIAAAGDAIFSDELNHASIIDGCRLSRAATFVYRHRDLAHLEDLLRTHAARRKLIVTDGVFSMDGDIAPLPGLAGLAERHGAVLMVDDAHATGVLGRAGRGTAEHFGMQGRVHIQMGTFGKALGSFGAYVAGDRGLVQYLLNTSRSFIFSTALPPAVCAASLAALHVLAAEPERRERLWRNRARFADGLAARGIPTGPSETPIVPVLIGDPGRAVNAARRAFELGVLAPAIRPPSVPPGSSRIRTTVTAAHTNGDIDRALRIMERLTEEGFVPHGRT
jgi:glycine C-acetyltransferase/8-amino-7-oxononanoate synthase